MNTFGKRFTFTTFGESHGIALGCVIDGVPAGLSVDEAFIQSELDRRKPGKSKYETARKESDTARILSGVFEGKTTGTPIGIVIYNEDQKSKDYGSVKDLFRPGHADFTYFHKYGIRDYRGGGRSSARETSIRVAAGAVAKLMLQELGIEVLSGVESIGDVSAKAFDYQHARTSEICALDADEEAAQKEVVKRAKNDHDSVGGVVRVVMRNVPKGLGEPMYYKLDALLAEAMMGINAVKAVEIGDGFATAQMLGSQNNDTMHKSGFDSNHAGGILGGISTGEEIVVRVYFKPTPSIFKPQSTLDVHGDEVECRLEGRHDPCVAIRGSVVAESMAAVVIADLLLLNLGRKLEHLKKVY